ncbi:MAG: flagellar export protein FliJ [Desulfopila sp.]
MKPFTLTTVLRYRQQLEDAAVTQMTQAQRHLEHQQRLLQQVQSEYRELLDSLQHKQANGIAIDELLRYESWLDRLKQKNHELAGEVESAEKKVEQRRRIVVAKSRDKKVLEQLKVRQNSAWQRYLDKKETAQLDEIAVLAHERKDQNS